MSDAIVRARIRANFEDSVKVMRHYRAEPRLFIYVTENAAGALATVVVTEDLTVALQDVYNNYDENFDSNDIDGLSIVSYILL